MQEYIIRIRRNGLGDLFYCLESPLLLTIDLEQATKLTETGAHWILDKLQKINSDLMLLGRVISYRLAKITDKELQLN